MAYSYGRKFRRIAAEALTADPDEMRALIQRILPAREDGGARVLRLETEADCKVAPAVIVFAFFADALTGDEAADLLRKTEDPAFRKQVLAERAAARDPLWRSILAWGEVAEQGRARDAERLAGWERDVAAERAASEAERCGAAKAPGGLVNNNENTSAASCDAAISASARPP